MSRAQKYFGCACVCTALVIVHFVAPPVLRLRLCALRSCAFIAMRLYACACLHLCVPPLWQVLTCVCALRMCALRVRAICRFTRIAITLLVACHF